MSDINAEMQEIEQAITVAEALERLRKNPDWILIIEQGYLKDYPALLLNHKSNDHYLNNPKALENINAAINSIPSFHSFLRNIEAHGSNARMQKEDLENYISEEEGN